MVFSEIMTILGGFALLLITSFGYIGIFFLMVLESMIFPMPSELVMPFAGFAASQGSLDFMLVIISSTLGSIVGSLLSYYMGMKGGHYFIKKYGKYFMIEEHVLDKTENIFKRKGGRAVLISRFIPAVRHVISIFAGIGKMDIKKFIVYTIIGAAAWNTFLAYIGFELGQHWNIVRQYTEPISLIVVIIIVLFVVYFYFKHFRKKEK